MSNENGMTEISEDDFLKARRGDPSIVFMTDRTKICETDTGKLLKFYFGKLKGDNPMFCEIQDIPNQTGTVSLFPKITYWRIDKQPDIAHDIKRTEV